MLRLSTVMEAPDYVKAASILPEDVANLPDGAFAIPHRREFPVDTAGHVWLGYGYCKSANIADADLLAKLQKAAALFSIAEDLKAIDTAFSQLVKQASHTKAFAVKIDFGDPDPTATVPMRKSGGVHGFYPISSAFEVENSAVKLANDQPRIPLEVFAEGCRNLVKAAREFGVSAGALPKRILDYGVERVPVPEVLTHFAEMRKAATQDDIYLQIAQSAINGDETRASHEWAELWLNADRQNGIKQARTEPDPFLLFNSGPTVEEMERQIESWVDIAGAPVPVTKVASVREEVVRKWFSKDPADKLMALVKQAASATGSELTLAFQSVDKAIASAFLQRLIQT